MFDPNDDELKRQIMLRSLLTDQSSAYGKPLIGNDTTAGIARGVSNAADLFVGRKPQFPIQNKPSRLGDELALASYKQSLKPEADTSSELPEGFVRAGGKVMRDPTYKAPAATTPQDEADANLDWGLKGQDFMKQLSPQDQATVQGLIDHNIDPIHHFSGMQGQKARSRAFSLAQAVDPNISEQTYPTQLKTQQDFKAGKTADQIQALNTATKHSGRIQDEMKSLGNMDGPLAPLNGPKNWLADTFGGGKPKAASLSIAGTFDELATALKKSGATDTTIEGLKNRINENMSPEAQKEVLSTIANLLSDQESSIQSRYTEGMGTEHKGPFFDKYAQHTLARLKSGNGQRIVSGNSNPTPPPAGATHYSPSTGKYYDAQGNELNVAA